jgi:hypothetical protein
VTVFPVDGLVIVPPQRSLRAASFPYADERAPHAIAIIRKTIATMNVKIPYGIAKHGFFILPVAHPRRAMRIPTIPMTMFPFPIPAPSSIPGMFKLFFYSAVIGTFPDCMAPKMSIMRDINPMRTDTPITITEHFYLYPSL